MTKDVTGFQGAMTQVLMGNSYSNTPIQTATFTFAPNGSDLVVTLREDVIVQTFGREQRTQLNDKEHRTAQQQFLEALKLNIEKVVFTSYMGVIFNSRESLLLAQVLKGAPAERAGLQAGDMMVSVAGVPTTTQESFHKAIDKHKPGDLVGISAERQAAGNGSHAGGATKREGDAVGCDLLFGPLISRTLSAVWTPSTEQNGRATDAWPS